MRMSNSGFSKKQLQILAFPNSKYTALICDGAVRSGKTSIMSIAFVIWAMRDFNGRNFAICGKSVKSAVRNIIQPLLQVKWLKQHGYNLKYQVTENCLKVTHKNATNYIYIFGGKDESSYMLIQGLTLAGLLLDEVALMPKSFVDQALARCSVEGSRFWFNCNPDSPQHWFYLEWIQKAKEKNALHLHFLMHDNPSLSDEILLRYESLYSGVFYERYILGRWVVAEGLVYPNFNTDIHVLKGSLQGIQGRFYVSIDYGTLNPCSMGLWCVQSNRAIRVKEYYWNGRATNQQHTDEEYYAALEELTRGYYITKVIIDPSAASFIETIRRHRKFSVWDADNEVINGIRITSSLISGGMILIHESCKDSIREFGLYRWDEKHTGGDKVIKEEDHAMDDIRYFCNTILAREFRWVDWRGNN